MTSKHTAGPWEVYIGHDGAFQDEPHILASRERTLNAHIAILSDNGKQTDANARLIAAAPALLEACQAAYEANATEWLYQTGQFSRRASPPSNYPPQGSVHGAVGEANELLSAAIAQALGEEVTA